MNADAVAAIAIIAPCTVQLVQAVLNYQTRKKAAELARFKAEAAAKGAGQ